MSCHEPPISDGGFDAGSTRFGVLTLALPGRQDAQLPTGWRFAAITRRGIQAQMWYHFPEGTTTTENVVLQGLRIEDAKAAEDDWQYLGNYPDVKADGQGGYEPTTVLVFIDP